MDRHHTINYDWTWLSGKAAATETSSNIYKQNNMLEMYWLLFCIVWYIYIYIVTAIGKYSHTFDVCTLHIDKVKTRLV